MRVILLEDQYAPKIYKEIISIDKKIKFPIKGNIKDPLAYLGVLENIKVDYTILLDNYFPGKGYEEPLGDLFLKELLKTGKDYQIVCISDRGKRLLENYEGWKKADEKGWIIGWCNSKRGDAIHNLLDYEIKSR